MTVSNMEVVQGMVSDGEEIRLPENEPPTLTEVARREYDKHNHAPPNFHLDAAGEFASLRYNSVTEDWDRVEGESTRETTDRLKERFNRLGYGESTEAKDTIAKLKATVQGLSKSKREDSLRIRDLNTENDDLSGDLAERISEVKSLVDRFSGSGGNLGVLDAVLIAWAKAHPDEPLKIELLGNVPYADKALEDAYERTREMRQLIAEKARSTDPGPNAFESMEVKERRGYEEFNRGRCILPGVKPDALKHDISEYLTKQMGKDRATVGKSLLSSKNIEGAAPQTVRVIVSCLGCGGIPDEDEMLIHGRCDDCFRMQTKRNEAWGFGGIDRSVAPSLANRTHGQMGATMREEREPSFVAKAPGVTPKLLFYCQSDDDI